MFDTASFVFTPRYCGFDPPHSKEDDAVTEPLGDLHAEGRVGCGIDEHDAVGALKRFEQREASGASIQALDASGQRSAQIFVGLRWALAL